MKKVLVRGLIGLVVLYLLLIIGGAWYFAELLLYPGEHVCSTEHYAYCGDPSVVGLKFEDVNFPSRDGLKLSAWFIAGQPGAPAVLLVHGRNATRREGLRYAPSLHNAGFNLLMVDLRHSGVSEKSFNSMGFYERLDVKAGVDYLLNTKKMPAVGVFGFSMGAATSILTMAEDVRIKAGVFESPFESLSQILADRARIDYNLPPFLLVPLTEFFFGLRGHMDTNELRPIDRIASIAPRPVFIIHGTADLGVPFEHGKHLFEAAREPRQFWEVPNGLHTRAWNADRQKAETVIPEFFSKNLR